MSFLEDIACCNARSAAASFDSANVPMEQMPCNLDRFRIVSDLFNMAILLPHPAKQIKFDFDRPNSLNKVKAAGRNGWLPKQRRQAWLLYTGAQALLDENPDMYTNTLAKVFPDRIPDILPRVPDFGGDASFLVHDMTKLGLCTAHRILIALTYLHPDIETCAPLPDMLAVLLIFFPDKEAFVILHKLLIRSKQGDDLKFFLPVSGSHTAVTVHTFDSLFKKHEKALYTHMSSLNFDAKTLVLTWYSRLFVSVFPFTTVLRILDAFMIEGEKILHRVALAVFRLQRRRLLRTETAEQISDILSNATTGMTNPNSLLSVAFSFYLTRRKCNDLDEQHRQGGIADAFVPVAQEKGLYYPKFEQKKSEMLTLEQCFALWSHLPGNLQIKDPKLVFSCRSNGYSVGTLVSRLQSSYGPHFLIVKTGAGDVFGAFIPFAWDENGLSKHNVTAFVFILNNDGTHTVFCQDRNKDAKDCALLQYAKTSTSYISIGDGETNAIRVNADFSSCSSNACKVFASPPLCRVNADNFTCIDIEVWSFAS